ncbi:DUF4215 domain-containing protein [Hyalangium minutum]|uniref:Arsenical pump-driving ATPase n=1 Tax=Hyalangium minutum TaxID=394096 RepID=A0A085WKM4_9BACT|nr:DUF4215 domain-containing protein [Hyalangium minutum]KFE68237.1 Arsenical pump-driving ATPase [Hyalangium minutum]
MKRMTPSWTLCVHGVRFMLALTALTLSACYESGTITCSSGLVCPSRMTCSADGRSCLSDSCGDSVRQAGEACDDGNKINGDGCSSDCRSDETCGNGIVDEIKDEVCDFGDAEPGDGCSADCKSDEECGNGIIDQDEACDDRNTLSGDGCSADCKSDESCGNRIKDLVKGEVCDDGNNLNGDQCSADCLSVETCGNGVRDEGEECDDGPSNNEDHCLSSSCKLARCGDGVVNRAPDSTEQCDPGVDPVGCNYNCTLSQCGDGIVNAAAGEQCDLGGGENSFCTRECKVSYCGDRYTNAAAHEECDYNNPQDRDGCLPNCKRDLCGDGELNPGEVCDDGNRDACGTCNATCTKVQPIQKARGSIEVMAEEPDGEKVGKLIKDEWKFTISDGKNLPRGFEFDKPNTDDVTEGFKAIPINNGMTSFDVANAIYTAIQWAGSLQVEASYDGAHTISLVHVAEGMRGNQIIVGTPQNQIYDILKISGMSGGVARDCSEGISCKSNDDCAPGLTCRESPRTCRP